MPQLLANAFAHCRNLRWLEIECYDVTDSHMLPAIASLRWLDIVALPAASGLTDAVVCALAQNCRDLSCLGIHSSAQVTEAALVQLTECCRKLSHLEVHHSSMSTATANALTVRRKMYRLEVTIY
jgi:hypothetical protein